MIGFFPNPYPDELVYSWLARYKERTGCLEFKEIIYRLFVSPKTQRQVEFFNDLTEDVKKVITMNISAEDVIMKHTMFPYYARFTPVEQRKQAFEKLVNMQGSVSGLLGLTKKPLLKTRFLKYCPLCVEQDREIYGETFWHRIHQIPFMHICPVHGCDLYDSEIPINQYRYTSLDTAERKTVKIEVEYTGNDLEVKYSKYVAELFFSNLDINRESKAGDYLQFRLESTEYYYPESNMRKMKTLVPDFQNYCEELRDNHFKESLQIERVFNCKDWGTHEICLIAMFLDISAQELIKMDMPSDIKRNKNWITQDRKNKHVSWNRKDWDKIDEELLPKVKTYIAEYYNEEYIRPAKVSVHKIEKRLGLCDKTISVKLPKCAEEIRKHMESYEEFWAREIAWAVRVIKKDGKDINWTNIRALTKKKRDVLGYALPYLDKFTTADVIEKIQMML